MSNLVKRAVTPIRYDFTPTTTRFTSAAIEKLKAEYGSALEARLNPSPSPSQPPHINAISFTGTPEQVAKLQSDVRFYDTSLTTIPLENITSRIDNYRVISEGHTRLAAAAAKLLSLDINTGSAGLFLFGPPGVGKTHAAIGLAKVAMAHGINTLYLTPQTPDVDRLVGTKSIMPLMILDDLNSPYGVPADLFKKVILKIHEVGGRVFVTSNMSFADFMSHLYFANPADRQKWNDRTKNMLLPIELAGKSQREAAAWWNA